jgi:N-glycosylase/DNA lyase
MVAKIINDKTIHIFDKGQFDWYAIRNSGQIFCNPPCEIIEQGDKIVIKAVGDKNSDWLWNYFDLGTDYSEIKRELMRFNFLHKPIEAGHGIRILRQHFAETVISFIISANNNIKRFTKTIEQIEFNKLEQYSEEDLKKMGCGYRAPYLVKTIRQLKDMDVSKLGKLDNESLRNELLALPGVGPKVASCIMLFCDNFHRLNIAPVDTWIKKAIEQLGNDASDAIINNKYAGVAQQYIFYYMQHLKKEL